MWSLERVCRLRLIFFSLHSSIYGFIINFKKILNKKNYKKRKLEATVIISVQLWERVPGTKIQVYRLCIQIPKSSLFYLSTYFAYWAVRWGISNTQYSTIYLLNKITTLSSLCCCFWLWILHFICCKKCSWNLGRTASCESRKFLCVWTQVDAVRLLCQTETVQDHQASVPQMQMAGHWNCGWVKHGQTRVGVCRD